MYLKRMTGNQYLVCNTLWNTNEHIIQPLITFSNATRGQHASPPVIIKWLNPSPSCNMCTPHTEINQCIIAIAKTQAQLCDSPLPGYSFSIFLSFFSGKAEPLPVSVCVHARACVCVRFWGIQVQNNESRGGRERQTRCESVKRREKFQKWEPVLEEKPK